MITKTLAPILHRDAYTRAVEPIVASYFRDVLYGPLLEILSEFHVPGVRRTNATEGSALAAALKRGDVWYADGVFSGTFSPYVARELRELGAEFVQKGIGPGAIQIRGFRISIDRLPPEVRSASVESLNRAREVHKQVGAYLDAAATNYAAAPTGIDVDRAMVKIVDDLNSQFSASVEGIEAIKAISVKAQITPAIREQLTKQLTENLNLDVKNFLAHEIPELRKLAEENAFAGGRADKLARIIQARYGVGRRKAAFLAEQETSLVVSKYREGQARGIGSQFYVWSTSHDERVRHDHKRLNNTRQSWDVKPVTNLKTGARNAPGEDYRCRCVAMPMLSFQSPADLDVRRNSRFCVATRARQT